MAATKKRNISLLVTNDLATDQRIDRIAQTLVKYSADVMVVGRKLPDSPYLNKKNYSTKRLILFFKKGPLFYLFFNIRAFIYLLFRRVDVIIANDLDTLLAGYLLSRCKRIPLVFDSHELFTEVPELRGRDGVRKIWKSAEKYLVPMVTCAYTVCGSIAKEYKTMYNIEFSTIRNLPYKKEKSSLPGIHEKIKDKKIILYQGSVNIGRGLERIISALKYLDNTLFIIIGRGDIEDKIKQMIKDEKLTDKVLLTGVIPYEKLHAYTQMAHLGISLEENMGKNYYYSLPNKLFDYIQAKVPVLTSSFPEVEYIVNSYNIGITTNEQNIEKLADIIRDMLINEKKRNNWKENLEIAANELVWENEQKVLIELFSKYRLI